ncbi:MAG: hypothetical protein U7M05_11640, partial [Candidatus Igneacidithiobacillus chanchocoensis]
SCARGRRNNDGFREGGQSRTRPEGRPFSQSCLEMRMCAALSFENPRSLLHRGQLCGKPCFQLLFGVADKPLKRPRQWPVEVYGLAHLPRSILNLLQPRC